MSEQELKEGIIEAASAWVEAKRAWEASSRELSRPENYGELKGNVRRAERRLLGAVQALELQREETSGSG